MAQLLYLLGSAAAIHVETVRVAVLKERSEQCNRSMTISIIIPCYNAADHIERCLKSVFQQVHRDLQIVAVDDGSTDGTVARIRAMEVPSDLSFVLIEQTNSGAAQARNVGLQNAIGTYVQFLDADDELFPEKLHGQALLVRENNEPDLVVASYRIISPAGEFVRDEIQKDEKRDTWLDVMQHGLGITSAILWKRSAVQDAGGWDASLGSSQEYDLLFRILKNGATIVRDPLVNTLVHKRHDSISHTNLARNWARFVELRGRMADHVRSLNDGRDLQPYCQVIFDSIRILYAHDPKIALSYHKSLLPSDFRPTVSQTSGRSYIMLHRIFGFHGAQRIRALITGS